ncbi:MAG: ATP12 family protein [Caulobacteraceae bacterium]
MAEREESFVGATNGPRRFFARAEVIAEPGRGYGLRLDGRPIFSPSRNPLVTPSRALAEAIAQEWEGQGAAIDWSRLALTRLAFTALDRIAPDPAAAAEDLIRYARSDLLACLASEPPSLLARQKAVFAPIISWAEESLGASFACSEGLAAPVQNPDTLAAIRSRATEAGAFALAGLAFAAALFGSAILGLAVAAGRLGALEALRLSRLEERFQQERWGETSESQSRRRSLETDAELVEAWFRALGIAVGGEPP